MEWHIAILPVIVMPDFIHGIPDEPSCCSDIDMSWQWNRFVLMIA
jgi:hypothetical protein